MTKLVLTRFANTPFGMFGRLDTPGETLYTLEPPWRNNERNVSCIPLGNYSLRPRMYYNGGYNTIEIFGGPIGARTHILFHKGNYLVNTRGCILVGLGLSSFPAPAASSVWGVAQSSVAFNLLMQLHEVDKFNELEIVWDNPFPHTNIIDVTSFGDKEKSTIVNEI